MFLSICCKDAFVLMDWMEYVHLFYYFVTGIAESYCITLLSLYIVVVYVTVQCTVSIPLYSNHVCIVNFSSKGNVLLLEVLLVQKMVETMLKTCCKEIVEKVL